MKHAKIMRPIDNIESDDIRSYDMKPDHNTFFRHKIALFCARAQYT